MEVRAIDYEELLHHAHKEHVQVLEDYPFCSPDLKGLYCDETIALSKSLRTTAEKACILAEELGHHHTSCGNILEQKNVGNRKQEYKARLWAYNKQVGLLGIVRAYERGCQNQHEAAEYLGVTDKFFQDALDCYRKKYGCYTRVDNYILLFEPTLAVIEQI